MPKNDEDEKAAEGALRRMRALDRALDAIDGIYHPGPYIADAEIEPLHPTAKTGRAIEFLKVNGLA